MTGPGLWLGRRGLLGVLSLAPLPPTWLIATASAEGSGSGRNPRTLVAPWQIEGGARLFRDSPALGFGRAGGQEFVGPDVPRFAADGALLLEPAGTPNIIRNPSHDGQEGGAPGRLARFHRLSMPRGLVTTLGRAEAGGLQGTTLRLQGTAASAGGVFYAPEEAAIFRSLIAQGGTWCFSNRVALLGGTLPAQARPFMLARESGPLPCGAQEGAVPLGAGPEGPAVLNGTPQLMRVRKTVARSDSTGLDFGFLLTVPGGVALDVTLFLADGWMLERGRFATSPTGTSSLRGAERLEVGLLAGHEGTLLLELTVPERAAEERPVLRLRGTSIVEVCVVPECFALVARQGGVAGERTEQSHNLPKGGLARVALCWSEDRFAFSVEGRPLQWCRWSLPGGFATLEVLGFNGRVRHLFHTPVEVSDGTLRLLSRATPAPMPRMAPRHGAADGQAGLRMRDDPNRSPLHLTAPRDKINDPNGPFWDPIRRLYHVGFQYAPTGILRRDGVRPPEFPNPVWGHASGPDLVALRFRGIWLRPGFGTPGGRDCSSGSVIHNTEAGPGWEERGSFTLYHTGGGMGFAAESKDGERWRQDFTPIIGPEIAARLSGLPVTETRDPAVFDHQGQRYLAQGVRVPGRGPCVLLFRFKGRRSLEFVGVPYRYAAGETLPGNEGLDEIWECADLQQDGESGRWVLLYSVDRTYAVVGDLDLATGQFREASRRVVDAGRSYAGKLFHDRDGHLAWMGWNAESRDGDRNDAAGQDGVLSLPMRLSVNTAGRLLTRFHPDVLARRENERHLPLTDGITARFDTEAIHVLLRARGDMLLEFTDETGTPCRAWLDRRAGRLGVTNQPPRAVTFSDGEVVTLEAIRGGSVYHLLVRGEASNEELLVTARAYTTPPARPADPQRPCGQPGIRLPNGASLISATVADLRPASADRFTT